MGMQTVKFDADEVSAPNLHYLLFHYKDVNFSLKWMSV